MHERTWVVLAIVCALSACDQNESGNVAASVMGDVSRQAAIESPVAALHEACGSETTPTLRRQPYLQQVTASSAMLGWVTTRPMGERVLVTRPDGRAITTAAAIPQNSNQRRNDEKQMWAAVTELEPATIYCYAIVNGDELVARAGFRTAPAPDDPAPIRVLAFGDSGHGGSDQMALRDQMFSYPYQLIVHTGDVAYEDGTLAQFEDNVFDVYKDLFAHVPFYPIAGNHDYGTDDARPFREVFALPSDDSNERWYSFDWGRIHFAAIDTEQDLATQAEWLERDLAGSTAPWKIVYSHSPPYSSGNHGSDTDFRKRFAPIFEKHGVQLVLSGHDHHYERMHPQNGVSYVVTGGGGRGTYGVGKSSFTAFATSVIHYVYLEVGVDELALHAVDASGVEFDSMVIPRVSAPD